ncbi:MAG: hypothetical protein PHO10_03910 [Gemmiger sp.]|nr:hypothetical protein [Gemmiger sp.]
MTKDRFKELMKPITEGLFGKQRPYHMQEEPHYAIRPVGMLVEDLCRIDEADWGKYAFSREPLNGKFNDEQRRALTEQAIACGKEYAEKYAAQYGMRDPELLARKLGLTVDYPLMPQNTDRVLFAEFREPNTVHIYMDGVRKAEVLLAEPGVRHALTGELQISKLLLAHELFHFVEEQNKKTIWTKTYKIELWAPKPLHNRSTVGVLGEIAAMAFAKALTHLPYSPYVMDAFLVYGYAPEAASALYEEMMTLAGRTPRLPPAEDTPPALAT